MAADSAGTSPGRMLRILDLLEEAPGGVLAAETLQQALGFTRSTLYRHLKTLTEAGLVAAVADRGFALGPRVMELDYRMRQQDPLIGAARPVMAQLVRTLPGVALLCRLYRDRVLCLHQEMGPPEPGRPPVLSHYARGLARPIFRGAAARIILAHLPAPALGRLHQRHAAELAAAGLGATLPAMREALRAIRSRGWDATEEQVTPGVSGIAAPLFDAGGEVLGSLSVTMARTGLAEAELARLAAPVVFAAGVVTESINPK